MKKYKRSLVRLFVILFSTFLFFKLIMSFKQENSINKLTKSTKLVNQETVKLEENQIFVPVYGTLQSVEQISIVSQASGVLIGDNFKSGVKFQKGDTLAYIQYDELQNNLNTLKSNLLNQTSRLVSEIKFDYPDLYVIWYDFMKKISFNTSLPSLPKINNEKFKNYLSGKFFFTSYFNAKSVQDKISKHIFIASFNGILSQVNVKPGNTILQGQSIAVFFNPNNLELEADVSIKNTLLVKKGMEARLKSDEIHDIQIGFVSRVNKTLDPSSQNMSVFIKATSGQLYNGMYVYGDIFIGKIKETYLVDRSLLIDESIFLVENNKLKLKQIQVIQISENNAIIKGLKDGDIILSESIKGAYDGMEIRVK